MFKLINEFRKIGGVEFIKKMFLNLFVDMSFIVLACICLVGFFRDLSFFILV